MANFMMLFYYFLFHAQGRTVAKTKSRSSTKPSLRLSVLALASCIVMPLTSQAAGLGRIVVHSALGQPLRAEIEVTATREELVDMKAQLASPESFRQAGLDYAQSLQGIRFSLDKRPSGQVVIKLSSDRPINEPFVDMLLELYWPAGRLVREYTFLLDPPEMARASPATQAPARPAARSGSEPRPADAGSADAAVSSRGRAERAAPAAENQGTERAGERAVRRGDTLAKIAAETKHEGVSIEQMLAGLLRANPGAFNGGNMNRLKTGKIISVPDKSTVESISPGEARKLVVAHASEWNAYRNRLAEVAAQAPAGEDEARQETAGRITAKVEDKAASAAEPKDRLKLSKTESASGTAGSSAGSSQEDLIAKDKALKDANERLASLEKTVADLQKLLELKNQNLAELQKQAAAQTATGDAKKPAVEPGPQELGAAPHPAAVASPAVDSAAKPGELAEAPVAPEPGQPAGKPVEAAPAGAEPAQGPEATPSELPQPRAKPAASPLPPDEPGLVEELLANSTALAGGGGILALIAAFFVSRRRRAAATSEEPATPADVLAAESVAPVASPAFRDTEAQSVESASAVPAQSDFSQAGSGGIDADDVDPVAEADVYMAYGRDAQAEEILLDARQKDPKRRTIPLKLLEIYSNRKDLKKFETVASELHRETGGTGPEWEKVAAMGLLLEPGNALFGGPVAGSAAEAASEAAAPAIGGAPAGDSFALPDEASQLPMEFTTGIGAPGTSEVALAAADIAETTGGADPTSLDFDLGLTENLVTVTGAEAGNAVSETARDEKASGSDETVLDFDLRVRSDAGLEATVPEVAAADIDFDFDLPDVSSRQRPAAQEALPTAALDFDFEVPADASAPASEGGADMVEDLAESSFAVEAQPGSGFDMSAIDLDLAIEENEIPERSEEAVGEAEAASAPQMQEDLVLAPDLDVAENEEAATKLDLAKAYEEMGDLEGARELLQEVLKEGSVPQQEKARTILVRIGE